MDPASPTLPATRPTSIVCTDSAPRAWITPPTFPTALSAPRPERAAICWILHPPHGTGYLEVASKDRFRAVDSPSNADDITRFYRLFQQSAEQQSRPPPKRLPRNVPCLRRCTWHRPGR